MNFLVISPFINLLLLTGFIFTFNYLNKQLYVSFE